MVAEEDFGHKCDHCILTSESFGATKKERVKYCDWMEKRKEKSFQFCDFEKNFVCFNKAVEEERMRE